MAVEYDGEPGINGYILKDTVPQPPGLAGDTNLNPNLGRRFESSLDSHFMTIDKTSADISHEFWAEFEATTRARYLAAPELAQVPGLAHPMYPNLRIPQQGDDLESPADTTDIPANLSPNTQWPFPGPTPSITAADPSQDPGTASLNLSRSNWRFIASRAARWGAAPA